jgi:hypothetical protein
MRFFILSAFSLGMLLTSCQNDEDRCDDLTCFNGGICLDGICDCPPGYVGFNCQDYDPCEGVVCLNGATCESGSCICPPGYSGINCEEFDPCIELSCENGANCVNGVCECLPNYQGINCEEQITPSSVTLIAIRVTLFPYLDQSGQPWDSNSLPDILPQISKGNEVLYTAPSPSVNADLGQNHSWQLPIPFDFPEIFDVHNFKLLEVNGNTEPREIGEIFFSPYNSNTDFPELLEFSSDSLSFKLQVEYTW